MYLIPLDILGNTRTLPPDLKYYQNKLLLNSLYKVRKQLIPQ
jgi:hypothetical protein